MLGSATHAAESPPRLGGAVRYEFALIGDMPYDPVQITNYFPNLIADLNQAPLAFVVHDGDIKAGATPCTDAVFAGVHAQFQTIRHPLIYVFGDNEWRDCGKTTTDPSDPEKQLEKLRTLFTAGDHALGQRPLRLERQSQSPAYAAFRENVRWILDGVVFAGLNVPGSDNYFGSSEFAARNAANLAWIKETFGLARRDNLRALMLVIQANPRFDLASTNQLRRGFNDMIDLLETETIAFGKPVVLVHGDTHYFRIDQPLIGKRSRRRLENFTRVETFGHPDVHWIRVSVDWNDPNVFQFRPQYVRKNLLQH